MALTMEPCGYQAIVNQDGSVVLYYMGYMLKGQWTSEQVSKLFSNYQVAECLGGYQVWKKDYNGLSNACGAFNGIYELLSKLNENKIYAIISPNKARAVAAIKERPLLFNGMPAKLFGDNAENLYYGLFYAITNLTKNLNCEKYIKQNIDSGRNYTCKYVFSNVEPFRYISKG